MTDSHKYNNNNLPRYFGPFILVLQSAREQIYNGKNSFMDMWVNQVEEQNKLYLVSFRVSYIIVEEVAKKGGGESSGVEIV